MATTTFDNLITFSRGSNATVTGSNGLIQWAPNNLLTFSEQIDNAAWSKNNGTVAANTTVAPDGTLTADKFVENTSNSSHFIIQSATTTANIHTFSVYAKAAGRTFVLLYHDQSNSGAVFNLSNGAITTPSGIPLATASVTDAGNGWYRCAITVTATAASNGFRAQLGDTATNYVYTGDGVSGILLWGAQLELGSAATTYNPTTVKNLLGFSEAFDNAAWTKTGASIVTGAQANPVNGLFNAQKLMENTANAQHRVTNSVTLAAAPHTFSAYLKAGERTWALMVNGTIANGFAYFNLSTGVVGSVGAGTTAASITAVGSGWYRCAITFTASAGSNGFEIRTASADGISIYTGDGNSGVYIYGAQLSDSASLDPYVPTPGAAPSSTAYYGPRFDYDPVTLQPRGLLVEEARTNLLTYSEQFDNAAWTKTAAAVTANATASPDGTTNADALIENTATSVHEINFGSISVTTGTAYTATIYVKANGRTRLRVQMTASIFPATALAFFDTSTGAADNVGVGATASMVNVGNGWYRCVITATASATASAPPFYLSLVSTGITTSYTGNGASGIFIWGAQLEAGAFATSYIPTIASTVTRSADVATITGSLFSQWYSQSAGGFIAEFRPTIAGSYTVYSATDGTTNNRVQGPASDVAQFLVATGGATQALLDGGTISPATISKIGSAYATNDFALSLNAGTVATDATGTAPVVDRFAIGSLIGNQEFLNGHIRSIRYVPVRAADFQLQQVTT